MEAANRHETRRSAGAWSLAESVVWPVGLLLAAPAVTHLRSLDAYGTVLLLTAIIGAAPILMAGIQSVLIQRLGARYDPSATFVDDGSIIAATLLAGTAAVLIVITALGTVVWASGRESGLLTTELQHPAFMLACAAGAVGIAFDQVSVGTLKGLSRFRLSAQLELFARGLQIVAAVAAAAWVDQHGAAAIAVGWATLAGSMVRLAVALKTVTWRFPAMPLTRAIELLRTGWWMLFGTLGGYMYMSMDRVIVGSLLGPRALGIYGIGVQIAQFCHMLPAAYFQPMMPAASRCRATHDVAGLGRLMRDANLRALLAVSLLVGAAVLLAPWFVAKGLDHAMSREELHMFWLCLAAAALMGLGAPRYHTLMGLGRFATVSIVSLAAGLLIVGLLTWIGTDGNVVECAAARLAAGAFTVVAYVLALKHAMRPGQLARTGDIPTVPREVA